MDLLTVATYAAIVFVLVMLVRAVVRTLRNEKQEKEGVQQWAAENGWRFNPADPTLIQQWRTYPVSGEGAATEVLTKRIEGQQVSSFKHQRSAGGFGGKDGRHMISVATGVQMPTVVLVPQGRAARFSRLTAVPQSDEAFNTRWTVLAEGQITEAVRNAITPEFRRHLSSTEFAQDVQAITLHERGLLIACRGPRDLTHLNEQVDSARALASSLSP